MEKLEIDIKKEIIDNLVNDLSKDSPDLYYSPTSVIAQIVFDKIQANLLSREKYEVVKDLSREDIQVLMSYSSSCC